MITGKICARELKINYTANVMKCPIVADKKKVEFQALPETEFGEVVLSLTNHSNKEQMFEIVPPNPRVSGIIVNPLVKALKGGQSTLVSLKYTSKFRDLTHEILEKIGDPIEEEVEGETKAPSGMVKVNKKLAAKIAAKKDNSETAAPVDPKGGKKGAPPPAATKKEDPPKKDAKGKGGPSAEEEEAELERLK